MYRSLQQQGQGAIVISWELEYCQKFQATDDKSKNIIFLKRLANFFEATNHKSRKRLYFFRKKRKSTITKLN